MKLRLDRIYKGNTYTIGKLYINDKYFCDTLEDIDRNLSQSMDLGAIAKNKVKDMTAIPKGVYKVTLGIKSPRFSKIPFYIESCNGYLPRLLDVPGFDGILIHVGDGPKGPELTSGCLLVGENKIPGQLVNGKKVFTSLYTKLKEDPNNITITIT